MPTKILMMGSGLTMLALGLVMTFAPREVLAYSGSQPPQPLMVLLIQAAGALYLGFFVVNWMAKDNLIGGIYSRPVAMGNLLHFLVVAIALVKALAGGLRTPIMLPVACLYVVFAAWFGVVVFAHPARRQGDPGTPAGNESREAEPVAKGSMRSEIQAMTARALLPLEEANGVTGRW